MPGLLVSMSVKEGDTIEEGQILCSVEAMKMENNILAEKDGTINKIHVSEGGAVLQGDVLVEIE